MLSNFIWWSHRNFQGQYSGLDTASRCLDLKHFENYPWPVEYCHNSRGYRDSEWPVTARELSQAIWCFGDSFTVGYGAPQAHTWPAILQQQAHCRCINVSLNGASNEWIVRKISDLVKEIHPSTIVVHWTFTHRRELAESHLLQVANTHWRHFYNNIRDPAWPDVDLQDFHTLPDVVKQEIQNIHYRPDQDKFSFDSVDHAMYDDDRALHYSESATAADDTDNLLACVAAAESLAQAAQCCLIHSFVSGFATAAESRKIMQKMQDWNVKFVPELVQVDWARDGLHYDAKTATNLAQQVVELISAAETLNS